MHTQVGLQALRVSLRDDTTMFCFTFRHDGDVPLGDVVAQQELLRRRLRDVGWEVREILTRMPEARTFYFDRASQILLDRAGGDHAAAFAAYHRRLATVVRTKQDAAIGMGVAFAPRNRAQLLIRNAAMKLMGSRGSRAWRWGEVCAIRSNFLCPRPVESSSTRTIRG
jgi:hypothetical protein